MGMATFKLQKLRRNEAMKPENVEVETSVEEEVIKNTEEVVETPVEVTETPVREVETTTKRRGRRV